MDMEEFESALEGLNRVLELSPYSAAIVYKDKGNLYYKLEEWELSLESFNKSLELDPYYTYAYKGRGSLYTVLNRFDEAEADLNKALEYAPDDRDALQRMEFLKKKRENAGK
jgi:tetratricopeptide (TPR) repeat protein